MRLVGPDRVGTWRRVGARDGGGADGGGIARKRRPPCRVAVATLAAAALLSPCPAVSADGDGGTLARSELPAPPGRVNHGPGLAELPTGELLLCWYSGRSEAGTDVRILCSRSAERGAGGWSLPEVAVGPDDKAAAAQAANKSLGNVVLFADARHGRLWMVHGVIQRWEVPVLGNLCRTWRCGRVDVRVSADGGRSWSAATRLDDQAGALPRAGVLPHPELGALLPLYLEGERTSYVRQVEPDATGLRLGPPLFIPTRGVIQPSLVLQGDGRVRAYLRDTAALAVRTAVLDPATGRWSAGGRHRPAEPRLRGRRLHGWPRPLRRGPQPLDPRPPRPAPGLVAGRYPLRQRLRPRARGRGGRGRIPDRTPDCGRVLACGLLGAGEDQDPPPPVRAGLAGAMPGVAWGPERS